MVKPEATVTAEASVSGVDSEAALEWLVREEVPRAQQSDGGDFEPTPPAVIQGEGVNGNVFRFQAPAAGEYRLFCQINNTQGASAVANFPFLVTTDARRREVKTKGKAA